MCKKETKKLRFILSIVMSTIAYADVSIGLLTSIESNGGMRMLYHNIPFRCEPFGVIVLERMVQNAPDPKECQNRIDQYYAAHPADKYFGIRHLHIQQGYHFEMQKEGCVLYANGPESYSEMLLRNGLAIVDTNIDNKEWNAKLRRAQQGAEKEKAGLHDTQIRKFCIKEEE